MALIVANYIQVQDSAGIPAYTWYAEDSVDLGNNINWIFGDVIRVQYVNLIDSSAALPTFWFALLTEGNVNGGNNTNWIFGDPPPLSSLTRGRHFGFKLTLSF